MRRPWWVFGPLVGTLSDCNSELNRVAEAVVYGALLMVSGVVALVVLEIGLVVLLYMGATRLEREQPSGWWAGVALLGFVLEGAQAVLVLAMSEAPKWLGVIFLLMAAGFAHLAWGHVTRSRSR